MDARSGEPADRPNAALVSRPWVWRTADGSAIANAVTLHAGDAGGRRRAAYKAGQPLHSLDAAEAGGASGTLTSVQQPANGIGSAVVTTVHLHAGTPAHAIEVALTMVLAVTAVCLLP